MDLQMGPRVNIVDVAVTISPNATITNPLGGDPVMCTGDIPGTATDGKDAATGLTPVMVADHIATFVVTGVKVGPANAAINAGDKVYMTSTGVLNGDTSGKFFGTAFGNDVNASAVGTNTLTGQLVASGNTTTRIRVWVGKGK